MKKKGIVVLVFVLLALPLILASTEINVKTYSDHKVSIFVQSTTPPISTLESFYIMSDATGLATVTFTGSNTEARINVKVTKDGEEVVHHIFEEMDMTSPLYLQAIPGEISENYRELEEETAENATEVVNETVEEVVKETVEEEVEENDTITGAVVENNSTGISKIPNFVYYIIGIVVVAGILVFFIIGRLNHRNKFAGTRGMKPIRVSAPSEYEAKLTDAENKIKAAQAEISRLRNQDI